MGQGGSFTAAKNTFNTEQFLQFQMARHDIVHEAFQMCVAPTSVGSSDPFELREDERGCVEEYALLYAAYSKREFVHYSALYENYQKAMYEVTRQKYMEAQARQDLQR